MRHVSGVALALQRDIEAVLLKARATRTVTSIGLCLDQPANPVRHVGIERKPEMPIERRYLFASLRFDTTYRIPSYRRWLDETGHHAP
jgi:hypothetical protein